jgi:hypothetical protein
MRTGHLIGLLGAGALVCLFACSSSDSGTTGTGGKGGSVNKDGGTGGTAAGGTGGTAAGGTGGTAAGGTGGTAGGGGCGFEMTSSKACDTCDLNKCGTQCAACTNSADCTAYVKCIQACTTDACYTTCQSSHAEGSGIMTTWDTCLTTNCATECPNCNITTNDDTCDGCFQTKCITECAACTSECLAAIQCVQKCTEGDTACETACETAHPTGVTPASNFLACMSQQCATECGGGG